MFPNEDTIQTYIDQANIRIYQYLLPDTCMIYPLTRVDDGSGGYTEAPGSLRSYNSSTDIPCRLDPTRQYRDQDIFDQEITVTDYFLNVPKDAPIFVDDIVVHMTNVYQIKKLTDDQSWRSVKKAYVVSVR